MRLNVISLLLVFGLAACGTVVEPEADWSGALRPFGESMTAEPPDARCQPIRAWDDGVESERVYSLRNYRGVRTRCNVAPFSIAVRGDGLARAVYGRDGLGPFAGGVTANTNIQVHREEAFQQAGTVLELLRRRIRDGDFGMAPAIECRRGFDGVRRCREVEDCRPGEAGREICTPRRVRVLIFAHGGMVSHQSAVTGAETLAQAMLEDEIFPVFLIWNSHFFDAYTNYLCCVSQRAEPARRAQNFTIAARVFGDLGSGLARLPQNYLTQGGRFQRSVLSVDDPLYHLPHVRPAPEACLQAAPELIAGSEQIGIADLFPNLPSQADTQAWRMRARLMQSCHNAGVSVSRAAFENGPKQIDTPWREANAATASPTVVFPPGQDAETLNALNEIPFQRQSQYVLLWPFRVVSTLGASGGQSAWNNMVRRSRMAMFQGSEFLGTQFDLAPVAAPGRAAMDAGDFAGFGGHGVFFERWRLALAEAEFEESVVAGFRESLAQEPLAHTQIEITFVGHSMGAFIANAVLERYAHALPIRRVVYMGGAAPIREFNFAARQALARRSADQPISFYNLMLHPLAESRELAPDNRFAGSLPQGSLLEWIDEYFEGPRVAGDRTMGKWSNIWRAWPDLDPDVRNNTLFRIFPAQDSQVQELGCLNPQHRCHPRSHGEFTNHSFWREEFWVGPQAARTQADP